MSNSGCSRSSTKISAPLQYYLCGVLSPGQLLPCPIEVVADFLPKYLLLCNNTKSFKEDLVDSTWVQSTIVDYFIEENMVYIGTVNINSKC